MTSCLDLTVIEELKQIMQNEMGHLFEIYLEDCETKIKQLADAMLASDCELTRRIAHSLKGSSRNVGAKQLADICELLELAAREKCLHEDNTFLIQITNSFNATKIEILQGV